MHILGHFCPFQLDLGQVLSRLRYVIDVDPELQPGAQLPTAFRLDDDSSVVCSLQNGTKEAVTVVAVGQHPKTGICGQTDALSVKYRLTVQQAKPAALCVQEIFDDRLVFLRQQAAGCVHETPARF